MSDPSEPRVVVIVLTYNGRPFIEACLGSVLASRYPEYRVVVADNASQDGTADFVRSRFPSVEVVSFDRNLGFSAGYNRAISSVREEYWTFSDLA